jgi:predicted transcriptional regulator
MMAERRQQVVTLRRRGLSYTEIAAELKITRAQVRYVLSQAPDAPSLEEVLEVRPVPELTEEELRAREEARERHQASKARISAVCECPRRIWVARTVLAEAPILCGRCRQEFKPS